MKRPLIVAVDFDGTIVDHRFPKIGPDIPGALLSLRRLQEADVRLILWTMRSGEHLQAAVDYLTARLPKPLFGVNQNPEQASWTSSPKAYAQVYVDDAALGCPLRWFPGFARAAVDWSVVLPSLLTLLNERE